MANFLLGSSYFHTHPQLQKDLKVDTTHVIIDKNDFVEVLSYLQDKGITADEIKQHHAFRPTEIHEEN